MELTEKHILHVSRYISEIEEKIGDQLSANQRERALARLHARIEEKLKTSLTSEMEDAEIMQLLYKMGQPETQAAILVRVWGDASASDTASTSPEARQEPGSRTGAEKPATESSATPARASLPQSADNAVWLGVASYIAEKNKWPTWALRFLFVLMGLISGPVALMLYMLVFVVLRARGSIQSPARFHPTRIVLNPLFTGAVMTLFYLGGIYGIQGIRMAHEKYLERPVPPLNEWAWLEIEAGRMFFGALLFLLPLALFSAMPLANRWDYSLKRFTQSGVVLYAISVSFGLASFITGIIINFVNEFAG